VRANVVGAGPGGASAALALAAAGASVQLVEKSAWPRAKTCGDGVSPLAVREARILGAHFAPNLELRRALVTTPGGIAFRGGWPEATPWGTIVERRAFDATLVESAIARGVSFVPATTVRALETIGEEVEARLSGPDGERTIRASDSRRFARGWSPFAATPTRAGRSPRNTVCSTTGWSARATAGSFRSTTTAPTSASASTNGSSHAAAETCARC
jgi:choline dehydrogenase-like flavoprotein